jgi:hypothetical protein
MDKKAPNNIKYKHVKKTLDTGNTINNVQILSDQFVSKRKNELFRRIKNSTVAKLIEENNNTESIYNLVDENNLNDLIISDNQSSVALHENSVYSNKTDITSKSGVTAITYATEMLGNLV